MTPTARIVALLTNNVDVLVGIRPDNICAYKINEENVNNTNAILVVSEDADGERDVGNDNILYYPTNYTGDMDLIERTVESFLYAHGIRRYLNAGHILTPDTENITNTLKFNYKETEDE